MSRFGPDLQPAAEGEGAWIAPRLGEFGTVGGLVPAGFQRHIRIDHGDDDHDGWGLPSRIVESIVRLGSAHTTTPDQAVFAIWEGYGWLNSTITTSSSRSRWFNRRRPDPFDNVRDEFERRKAELSAELGRLAKLDLGQRTYYLLAGPVTAASRMQDPISPPTRRVAGLWWPADRAWFVGSDTDLACTYLAGSPQFVTQVAEAWPVLVRPSNPEERLG